MMTLISRFPILLASTMMLAGFATTPSIVPAERIVSGGPPKDGIPALTYPKTVSAEVAAAWLKPEDRILGVVIQGKARAYPIRILNWHEIVNDRIDGRNFVVTYCPLCGSGMAFDSNDRFGVSGLLYESDVLLYDKKTESLWSQLLAQAVAGPRAGERLTALPLAHTSWRQWVQAHPDTTVLSRHTGYARDYGRDPYAGYDRTAAIYFPVQHRDNRLHPKAWVIGLEMNGKYRAWAMNALKKAGQIRETWQGVPLLIRYDQKGESVEIVNADSGARLPSIRLYWFAWFTFHPRTELWNL